MENKWFQWIIGERRGEVVIFDHIETDDGINYIVFKDNSRINENFVAPLNQHSLTNMYMAEVDSPTNIWTFKEEWVGREEEKWETNAEGIKVCVQPFIAGKKTIKLIPPRRSAPRTSNFGVISNSPSQSVQSAQPTQPTVEVTQGTPVQDINDPVYILMSKSKKQDAEITMNITISLPPKSLYDIAQESFPEGGEKFVEYIIQEISVSQVKEALKTALSSMYQTIVVAEDTDTQG